MSATSNNEYCRNCGHKISEDVDDDVCQCDDPEVLHCNGDERFLPRRGCLKCNKWIDGVRLR